MRSSRLITLFMALGLTCACVLPGSTNPDNDPQLIKSPLPQVEEQASPPPGVEQQARFCAENQGKLLFSSDYFAYPETGANYDIYTANGDGSQITRLTDFRLWEGYPSWSPDYCRFAYAASIPDESQTEIFVMNADGTEPVRLTTFPADDREPSWSPDGNQIVFTHQDGNIRDLYIMQADGSDLHPLTDHFEEDEKPEWSPVDDEIVFQSQRDGNFNIYVIRSDGTGLTRLTDDDMQDTHPTWSPDGKQIAFMSNRSHYNEIYVINRDGSGLYAVTAQGNGVPSPIIELSWSADGTQLAFGCSGLPDADNPENIVGTAICAVNVDGSNLRILAERGAHNSRQPDW